MSIPKPLTKDQVSGDLQGLYDNLKQTFGFVPNFFGVMARSPEVLKTLPPFLNAVMHEGIVEGKYKELVFLKASMVNGCSY